MLELNSKDTDSNSIIMQILSELDELNIEQSRQRSYIINDNNSDSDSDSNNNSDIVTITIHDCDEDIMLITTATTHNSQNKISKPKSISDVLFTTLLITAVVITIIYLLYYFIPI
jgi:ATP-dependent Zn protease